MKLTFNNDESLKTFWLNKAKAHRKADEFIQGEYYLESEHKGCAVGCLAEREEQSHEYLAEKTNVPEWLYRLQDAIFEGLGKEAAKNFVVDFYEAIPVGKDLEQVKWDFLLFILDENIERVKAIDTGEPYKQQVLDAQVQVREYILIQDKSSFAASADGSVAYSAAYSAARSAADSARSAADSAAYAARSAAADSARAATAYAARSAADSARSAADSARSAADSAADSARSAADSAYERYRDKLLELLMGD